MTLNKATVAHDLCMTHGWRFAEKPAVRNPLNTKKSTEVFAHKTAAPTDNDIIWGAIFSTPGRCLASVAIPSGITLSTKPITTTNTANS